MRPFPRIREYPRQLTRNAGESLYEYWTAVLMTLGTFGSLGVLLLSLFTFTGIGGDVASNLLQFQLVIGSMSFPLVPAIILGSIFAGTPAAFQMAVSNERERLQDDSLAILLFNTVTLLVAATQVEFTFSSLFRIVLTATAAGYVVLYLGAVVRSRVRAD